MLQFRELWGGALYIERDLFASFSYDWTTDKEISKDLELTKDNIELVLDRYDRNVVFTTGPTEKMVYPSKSFLDVPIPVDFPKRITEILVEGPAIVVDTLVQNSYQPLDALTSATSLQPFYNGQMFFKGDIKITMVLNTTPMAYGVVLISWLPFSTTPIGTYNADPYLLDISQSTNFEMTLPYCSPHPHYSFLKGGFGYNPQQQPTLYITKVGYNKMDSSVPSTILQLYYSWTNLTMMGPGYKPQSGNIMAAGAMAVTAGNVAWNLAREVPHYVKVVNTAVKDAKEAKAAFGEGYEQVKNLLGEFDVDIAQPGTEGFKQGYSSKRVRNDVYGDISTTSYVPSICTAGLETVAREPVNLCDPLTEHRMLDMLSIPCVRTWYDFSTTTDFVWIPTAPLEPIPDKNALCTFADSIVSMFRYWRGSMDLCFKFYTSPLISARFEIQWFFANGRTAKNTVDLAGTYWYREFLEVKGSTDHYLHLPWIFQTDWNHTWASNYGPEGAGYQSVWGVRMKMLNVSYSGTQSPHVFVVLIQAPGSDFQVKSLCSQIPYSYSPTYDPQCRVRDVFIGKVPVKPKRFKMVEDNYTMEGMAGRFSARICHLTNGFLDIAFNRSNVPVRQDFDLFDTIISMFAFFRGNIRVRIDNTLAAGSAFVMTCPNVILAGDATPTFAEPPGNGLISNMKTVFPILEFEVPSLSPNEWFYYTNTDVITEPITNLSGPPTLYFVAAGAGFGLAYPNPQYNTLGQLPIYYFSHKATARKTVFVEHVVKAPARSRKQLEDDRRSYLSLSQSKG